MQLQDANSDRLIRGELGWRADSDLPGGNLYQGLTSRFRLFCRESRRCCANDKINVLEVSTRNQQG